MRKINTLLINYRNIIPLFYKLAKIIIISIIGDTYKHKKQITFFLTIDTEAKFIDTIKLNKESYEKDIHDSCLKILRLANRFNVKVVYFIDQKHVFQKRQTKQRCEQFFRFATPQTAKNNRCCFVYLVHITCNSLFFFEMDQ